MQSEEAVEINRAAVAAVGGGDGDGRALVVVGRALAERHDGIETVHAAALEDDDHNIAFTAVRLDARRPEDEARHPCREEGLAEADDAQSLENLTTGWLHENDS